MDAFLDPAGPLRREGWRVFALPVPRATQARRGCAGRVCGGRERARRAGFSAQGEFRPKSAINDWQKEIWGAAAEMLYSLQDRARALHSFVV